MADDRYYVEGDVVVLSFKFYNAMGDLADPSAVTLRLKVPGQVARVVTGIVKDGVGEYHADIPTVVGEHGTHYYRVDGTGNLVASGEGSFIVSASQVL